MIYTPLPIGRVCRVCNAWKPYHELKKHKAQPDGVEFMCLACNRKEASRYYAEHAEQVKTRLRNEYAQFPEKVKARNARYSTKPENKRKAIERANKWRKEHSEKVKQYKQRWRKTHLNEQRVARQRYLTHKVNAITNFTIDNWQTCLKYWEYRCVYCGNQQGFLPGMNITQEHFVPVSKGGNYTPNNIVPACQSCNTSKSNRDPVEWLTAKLGPRRAKAKLREIEAYFASLRD